MRSGFEFLLGLRRGAAVPRVDRHAQGPRRHDRHRRDDGQGALRYDGGLLSACNGCDADANVSQIFANLHIGGGTGLHQVIDVNAGMTLFSNFRRTSGERLDPSGMVSAFTFDIGYGFGNSLSPRFQLMLLQDWGLVIHKRMSGQTNNTANQTTTRIGARYGLGSRGRGF